MLGLLLIYWLGKNVYTLAEEHSKNQWGYAILSIVVYYGTTFIVGLLAAIFFDVSDVPDLALGIIAIPFGVGGWWLFKNYLETKWKKSSTIISEEELSSFGTEEKDKNSEGE